jgi:hypothetical protein
MTPLTSAAVVIGLGATAVSGNSTRFIIAHTAAPYSSPRSTHCVRKAATRRLARIRSRVISGVETRNATLLIRSRAKRLFEDPADSIQRRSFTMINRLKRAPRSEFAAIMATGAAFFMIVLDTSIVNLALPRIKDVFHADVTAIDTLAIAEARRS